MQLNLYLALQEQSSYQGPQDLEDVNTPALITSADMILNVKSLFYFHLSRSVTLDFW